MPAITISDRLTTALQNHPDVDLKPWLPVLRTSIGETEQAIAGTTQILSIAIVGYWFLARTVVAEISVSGFKITDLGLIQKLLLLLISYCYYRFMALATRRRFLRAAYAVIAERVEPWLEEAELGFFVLPPDVFSSEVMASASADKRLAKWIDTLSYPIMAAVAFGAVIVEIYALVTCFLKFGFGDMLLWAIVFASLLFLVQGTLLFSSANNP